MPGLEQAIHSLTIKEHNRISRSRSESIQRDARSGLCFYHERFVDTEAEIIVIKPTPTDRKQYKREASLTATNSSTIATYSQRSLTLDLGLRLTFRLIFTIADDSMIHLCYFKLLLDVRRSRLIDGLTKLSAIRISTSLSSDRFQSIFRKFPLLFRPATFIADIKHGIYHYIETKRPPVHAKARKPSPDKFNFRRI
ncbi:unnamed protein product [Lepeophtheirus salmonis]|uniref:(salmon louse) hypothetical protein n=1 Tax=Lepeophtheirus salmonis TaxID=72036 RepID=A0A7R8CZ35_LEPSM|nr:unnamed protein product [Lepeophtheirus salmonis]CAF2972468.1 unnamed protein product [Lepeophtheirus salmonis]